MKHSFEHKLQVRAIAAVVDLTALVTCELQEMQSAIGRTTSERDRVLADMERIEQARKRKTHIKFANPKPQTLNPNPQAECGGRNCQRT